MSDLTFYSTDHPGSRAKKLNQLAAELNTIAASLATITGVSVGIVTHLTDGTFSARTLVAPSEGFTITNPDGDAGNPTFVLANDLAGVEGLATTGLATRTGDGTWTTRAITGTANQITVVFGDGIAGAPTVSLPAEIIAPGTMEVGTGEHRFDPTSTITSFRSSTDTSGGASSNHVNIFNLVATAAMTVHNVALIGVCDHAHPSGTMTKAGTSLEGFAILSGDGTSTELVGVKGAVFLKGNGTITSAIALKGAVLTKQGGSTGTVTTAYGLYLDEQTVGSTNWAVFTAGATPSSFGGAVAIAGALTLTGTPLAAIYGGSGLTSYAVGDILYASTTTALSKLADVATGNALISGGVGVAPAWGKIGISTHVSGLGTGVATALAVNIGSAGAFVTFNGALGTPSSVTLTNATGLLLTGLVASTTLAIGVGSVELGHATDTTITRTGAGDIAVEGKGIYRADGTDVPVTDGGTGRSTSTTAYGLIAAGTTATGAHQTLAAGATTEILVGGGASALPAWTTATGTGAPVRAGSPALTGSATAVGFNVSGTFTVSNSGGWTIGSVANVTRIDFDGTNFRSLNSANAAAPFDASAYKVGGTQVVASRRTGWGAPTGTPTRTTFATGSVTLPQLAERVKALIDDLTTHGLIGA